MNDLQQRVIETAAAWEVWCERLADVKQRAQANAYNGDLPDAAQVRDLQKQFRLQLTEAYARARIQCAIAYGADGVDTAPSFDEHWEQTWGTELAASVSAEWLERYRAAIARQTEARAAAADMSRSLAAAGG